MKPTHFVRALVAARLLGELVDPHMALEAPHISRLQILGGIGEMDRARHPDLERVVVAVRGPRRRKWGRGVEYAAGPLLQRVLAAGALVEIPECRGRIRWKAGICGARPIGAPVRPSRVTSAIPGSTSAV